MLQEKIILGDKREYTLSEYDVGDFIKIEEKYGSIQLTEGKIEPIIFWLWLSLKKTHTEMTLEHLYTLIPASFVSTGGINKIFDALSKLNKWSDEVKNAPSPVEKK